jgi:hypothetical protein
MQDPSDDLLDRVRALEAQLGRQRRWGLALVLLVASLALTAMIRPPHQKQRFTEIDVERLNIVEPDGNLCLVLANTPRLPSPTMNGKVLAEVKDRGPGMIFFDGKGTEVGGVSYGTHEGKDGFSAVGHLSFDQFKNDQVVHITYRDNGRQRSAGLYVVDRPLKPGLEEILARRDAMRRATGDEKVKLEKEWQAAQERGEFGAQRVIVGSVDRTAVVGLKDTKARERIRLSVDASDVARLEFLDEKGAVVYSLPPK